MRRSLLLPVPLLFACATSGDANDSFDEEMQSAIVEGSPEAIGVLAVANELSQSALDDDVGLDARAAKNIAKRRNGADTLLGTSDDNPYDTIAELDAVSYVGAAAFTKLLAYAEANGFVPTVGGWGTWQLENPSPDTSARYATWAFSASNVWTVGKDGLAEHFDGTSWTVVPTGTTETLTSVWGAASNDVWVVGAKGTVLRWNGTAFTKLVTNQTRTYNAVHGSSANDVWIVGSGDGVSNNGRVLHWNGTTLANRAVQFCELSLNTVHVASPTNVWLGGDQKTVCHWNGSLWSDKRVDDDYPSSVTGLYATATKTYAIYAGDIYRLDGSSWTFVWRFPDTEGWEVPTIYELRGRNDNDLWVSGSHGYVAHFNGQSWTPTRLPGNAGYFGLTLAGTNEAWAVGASARARLRNGQWREEYSVVTRQWLRAASASSATNVWALGSTGDIVRRTAAGWERVASPLSLDNDHSYTVLALADDDVWIGGTWNSAHWDGQTLSLVPELRDPYAMWAASPTNIWAVGESGELSRYNGSTWTTQTAPVIAHLRAIDGTSANDIWAIGGNTVLHYNGSTWSPVDIGLGLYEEVSSVVAIAPNNVWISGESKHVWHFDGTTWSTVPATTHERPWIRSGWASGPNDVWFVVEGKEILHWNGTAFEREELPLVSTLVHAGGQQWALGEDGTIRRR